MLKATLPKRRMISSRDVGDVTPGRLPDPRDRGAYPIAAFYQSMALIFGLLSTPIMPPRRAAKSQAASGASAVPKLVDLQGAEFIDELTILDPAPPKPKKKGTGKRANATRGENNDEEITRAVVTTNRW